MGYKSEFEIFEKKSLKIGNLKLKNTKRSFVRTIGRKIQNKFQNFSCDL